MFERCLFKRTYGKSSKCIPSLSYVVLFSPIIGVLGNSFLPLGIIFLTGTTRFVFGLKFSTSIVLVFAGGLNGSFSCPESKTDIF